MNREPIPDWERLYLHGHHFRVISPAVGDRYRALGPWRLLGYLGEHSADDCFGALHGPWRPTQALALRAVYRRARALGRIPTKPSP